MIDKGIENKQLNPTTHAGIAQMMARALQAHGLDADAIFAEEGLDLAAQAGTDQRVAAVAMQRVWRRAVELSGDEAFGLGFARQMHPAALQGLGFAWVASNTLLDAFQRLVRYYRMITTAGEVVLEDLTGEQHESVALLLAPYLLNRDGCRRIDLWGKSTQ